MLFVRKQRFYNVVCLLGYVVVAVLVNLAQVQINIGDMTYCQVDDTAEPVASDTETWVDVQGLLYYLVNMFVVVTEGNSALALNRDSGYRRVATPEVAPT